MTLNELLEYNLGIQGKNSNAKNKVDEPENDTPGEELKGDELEQEIDQEQRDKEADDPLITADLQLQPVGQTPQVPQEATQPTDQVTAQQVQQLFPFDTTAAAIAQRRTNRG